MPVLLTILGAVLGLLLVLALLSAIYGVILKKRYRTQPPADEIYAANTPDGWKLRLFRFKPRRRGGEPVLLIPGATANHFEFELPPGHSLADTLADSGYDVWVLDPRGRQSSTPPFGRKRFKISNDDYLTQDLPTAIDFVRAATRYQNVHAVGHSLGGMLLYAFDAAYGRDNLASLVTIGAPVGFERVDYHTPRTLFFLSNVGRPVLEGLTRGIAPIVAKVHPQSRLLPLNWDNIHPEADNGRTFYNAVELPPHGVALELDNWARNKVWRMLNDSLDVSEGLADLETPLLAIYGGDDPLTPRESVREFWENLDLADKQILVLSEENGHTADYNHIDLMLGKNSRSEVFEPIVQWLRHHRSTERLAPVHTAAELQADAASPGTIEEESDAYVREARGVVGRPVRRFGESHPPETFEPDEIEEAEYVETDELPMPVLPGASMEELARLAREIRQEPEGEEDEEDEFRSTILEEEVVEEEVEEEVVVKPSPRRKAAPKRNAAPPKKAVPAKKKPAANKKPAAKTPPARKAAPRKKPAPKRKPRP